MSSRPFVDAAVQTARPDDAAQPLDACGAQIRQTSGCPWRRAPSGGRPRQPRYCAVASTGDDDDHQPFGEIGRRLEKYSTGDEASPDRGRARYGRRAPPARARACLRRRSCRRAGSARRPASCRRCCGAIMRGHRRLDLDVGQRQVARHLVAQQHADFVEQLAKRFGRAVLSRISVSLCWTSG